MRSIVLFSLLIAGIIFYGCAGSPSGTAYSPYNNPGSFATAHNPDGSMTVFSKGNFSIKVMPFTDGRTRGALDRTADEFDELITQYTSELEKNPNDYEANIILAGLYINRGQPGDAELAINYSERALTVSGDDPQALFLRGIARSEKGDNAQALNDLESVLNSGVQDTIGIHYIMGMLYFKEGDFNAALESFENVRAIDPDFFDTAEIIEQLNNLIS